MKVTAKNRKGMTVKGAVNGLFETKTVDGFIRLVKADGTLSNSTFDPTAEKVNVSEREYHSIRSTDGEYEIRWSVERPVAKVAWTDADEARLAEARKRLAADPKAPFAFEDVADLEARKHHLTSPLPALPTDAQVAAMAHVMSEDYDE